MTSPPDVLYHYTTLAGVLGIVTNKRLWATSIRHLNDATEFMYAHGVLKSALEQESRSYPADVLATIELLLRDLDFRQRETSLSFSEAVGPPFVTSFSAHGSQLSQWRAYCRDGGVSLGFRLDALRKICDDQELALVQCSYDREVHALEAKVLARRTLEDVEALPSDTRRRMPPGGTRIPGNVASQIFPIRNRMLDEIERLAPGWKHHAFHEEAEWRLVSRPRPPQHFRVGRTAIIPYIEIDLQRPALMADERVAVLKEVMVGPCPEPELTAGTLWQLFNVKKFACPGIVVPDVPYRQW